MEYLPAAHWSLMHTADWTDVDPMVYLTPFLNLIKASDVSGPVTGAAAVALQRILGSDLLSELPAPCQSAAAMPVASPGSCTLSGCRCLRPLAQAEARRRGASIIQMDLTGPSRFPCCSNGDTPRRGSHQPDCRGCDAVQV